MSETITLRNRNLKALIKAFGGEIPSARVGILGGRTIRGEQESNKKRTLVQKLRGKKYKPSNAEIGAFHEFGTAHLPVRSFLRVPLIERLEKSLEGARAFDKRAIKAVIAEKSLVSWVKKIAVMAESIVAGAFATGGYGAWKPSDMRRKKNWQTLVETQQLRNSITSEVN